MSKPISVVINDIHYDLSTLLIADEVTRQAINLANGLHIPLIVAGDLHNTKANMRAECVNAMIKTFSQCETPCFILRGNHDAINEKSKEHSLNFLSELDNVMVVDKPFDLPAGVYFGQRLVFIPYHHDPEELRAYLKTIPKGSTLIMHQGVQGSNSGEYIQDKSAIRPEDVAGMRVISGHYHTRQDIKLPDGGLWTYTGNPYSLNFAEANDPTKGFHILMDDGSLEFIPTNLRKHIVLDIIIDPNDSQFIYKKQDTEIELDDLVWVKVTGTKEQISHLDKSTLGGALDLVNFRLDLIPAVSNEHKRPVNILTQAELLDALINQQNASDDLKTRLKQTWRGM